MKIKNAPVANQVEEMDQVSDVSRRRFFQLAGGVAGAGVFLAACRRKSEPTDTFLGSDDTGLLNYLYVLQQLEAAFYIQAVATPYYGLTVSESQLLTDVRDQEIAHREYLRTLLGRSTISAIVPDFSAVTFADRASVMKYASILEDMSVSAFNGAARYFINPDYVTGLAKIAAVEARHAAYFHDMQSYNSFANSPTIDVNGLDQAGTPAVVFQSAQAFLQTRFDASKLPN
jgi:hypothetical protein